jgi:hypothetical protein
MDKKYAPIIIGGIALAGGLWALLGKKTEANDGDGNGGDDDGGGGGGSTDDPWITSGSADPQAEIAECTIGIANLTAQIEGAIQGGAPATLIAALEAYKARLVARIAYLQTLL